MGENGNYSVIGAITLNIFVKINRICTRHCKIIFTCDLRKEIFPLAVATCENKFSILTCEIKKNLTLSEKRCKCFFTYIHLDLFRFHPSKYPVILTFPCLPILLRVIHYKREAHFFRSPFPVFCFITSRRGVEMTFDI